MLFHWRQNTQIALYPAVVVVSDVILNHGNKLLAAGEASAVVPLTLEDAPEAFHRPVVNALAHSGHTLRHLCRLQLMLSTSRSVIPQSPAPQGGILLPFGTIHLLGISSTIVGSQMHRFIWNILDFQFAQWYCSAGDCHGLRPCNDKSGALLTQADKHFSE